MVWATDQDASWMPSFRGILSMSQLVGDPRVDPKHAAEIIYLIRLGNAPGRSRKMLLGKGMSGLPFLACCHHDPDKRQKRHHQIKILTDTLLYRQNLQM